MSTLCILSYFIFKGTQCGGDLLTILHRSKQKYKEVAEFVGSRRTVRLKKKTRKDCTQVCLIPKFTGLTVRLFASCHVGGKKWDSAGGRELCSAPSCSYVSCMFQKDSRVCPRRQGPDLCCQPVAPAHSSSVFSLINIRTHNSPLGWEGQRA